MGSAASFLRMQSLLVPVQLHHHWPSIPQVLYHDTKLNPGGMSAWDVALSLHERSYLTGQTIVSMITRADGSPSLECFRADAWGNATKPWLEGSPLPFVFKPGRSAREIGSLTYPAHQ